ncbi:exodeoxyribonuclease VII large subunit, partial [Bosea sp. (in: a-proteobacteria)]|uniref:exodeoxyribonuclease VII large subunit n=1 Tax=Bosea sp. (in: a-proteobacteria) TaxID=1871050 RepID=UPI0025B9D13D
GPEAVLSGPRQRLDLASARLAPALAANARKHEQKLGLAAQRLVRQSPLARLAALRARLEGYGRVLAQARNAALSAESRRIADARRRLQELEQRAAKALARGVAQRGERLPALEARLQRAFAQSLMRRRERWRSSVSLLASLGPDAVLARGYALVRDEAGALIRDPAQLRAGQALGIQVAGGRFGVVVAGGGEGQSRSTRPPRRDLPKAGQGDLF